MVDVGNAADLRDGVPMIVVAQGRDLVLVRFGREVFALRDVCPHQSKSFLGGVGRARIVGTVEVGDVVARDDDPVLVCPFHGWEYQLRTGHCTTDPKLRVRRYPVEVKAGRVLIEIAS